MIPLPDRAFNFICEDVFFPLRHKVRLGLAYRIVVLPGRHCRKGVLADPLMPILLSH